MNFLPNTPFMLIHSLVTLLVSTNLSISATVGNRHPDGLGSLDFSQVVAVGVLLSQVLGFSLVAVQAVL